jgi:bifunctional non-homologous end joining protein LigD
MEEWRPIYPIQKAKAFSDPQWAYELKYDGFRATAHIDLAQGACTFYSRNQKVLKQFRELADRIVGSLRKVRQKGGPTRMILDGEIVTLHPETGLPEFLGMMRSEGERVYIAFDLLLSDSRSLLRVPFEARRKRLETIVPEKDTAIRISYLVRGNGEGLFEAVKQMDMEGVVAKRLKDPYLPGTAWLRFMNPKYSQNTERRRRIFNKKKRAAS